ncbi:MAG: aromatic ring-hydroxylating dioxygenase subunit alpha [Nitrospirae bacterium]|nr:aromatic ring-hydroxylating dioxygenase subunit alpha [Nitrospirota bacterium]
MLNSKQQDVLTRVGPGTPMGELLRRYWFPVAATCELDDRPTKKVRLLGEDLVLFRNHGGPYGLLQENCPHRGASLVYGSVEDDCIRCAYHGWLFDASGHCLDMPAEPRRAKLMNRVKAKAYRVEALGGLLFAYLGPEPAPLLPHYDLFLWNGVLRDIGHTLIPCNWLQIMENSMDPHHVEWLHGHHLAFVHKKKGARDPRHYRKRHVKVGFDTFRYGIIKRRVLEGGTEEDDDWKVGHPVVFPAMLRVGTQGVSCFQVRVPVDDTHTWHVWYSCYKPNSDVEIPPQESVPLFEVPWKDERGEFILDFVDGQDIMTWVTQGPIADRTRETLGSSDEGVVLFRRLLLEQLEKVQAGEDPMGVIRDPAENRIIELPQEVNKYQDGASFRSEYIEMGHSRYSPIRNRVKELFEQAGC